MATIRRIARKKLNSALSITGFQLVRPSENDYIKSFISFRETFRGAKKAGLSIGDYIDAKYHQPGATQATIDQLIGAGVLSRDVHTVCEVGPGSGRYLEKVLQFCNPLSYEIYETQQEWLHWLARTYPVVARDADGKSLRDTHSGSIDLVHAHKVFVYLPTIVACQYFREMIRVVRPGGQIVFDILSENCMDDSTIEKWLTKEIYYPCMMPRDFVIGLFARRHCFLRSSFFAPMVPGQSEYLVFVKDTTPEYATLSSTGIAR